MKLSTKARYGARALAELAVGYPDSMASVANIAEKQKISPKYLEHIMASLRAVGIVKAVRGMHGGYALARAPASITLKQLFRVLEGSVAPVYCVDHPDSCPMEGTCATRETWVEMKESMERVLDDTTVQDLVERKKRKTASSAPMYYI